MRRAFPALVLILACGDEDDPPARDASVAIDGGHHKLDAALIQKCGPANACQNGAVTSLPKLCKSSPTGQPTGDQWQVCVIDPQGRAAYLEIYSDEVISSPGWTHSNYAFVDSTLSDEGYDLLCLAERSKLTRISNPKQYDGGTKVCLRPSSDNGDD